MRSFCSLVLILQFMWSNVDCQDETKSGRKPISWRDFKMWKSQTIELTQLKHDSATAEIKSEDRNKPASNFMLDNIGYIVQEGFENFIIKFQIDDYSSEQRIADLKTNIFKNLNSCTEYTVTISLILNGIIVSTEEGEEAVLSQDFKTLPDNSLKPTLELNQSSTTSLTLDMKGADSRCTIISKKVTCKMQLDRDGKEIQEDSLDQIIIQNLIPGKEYNCIPEVIYKDYNQRVVGDIFSFNTKKLRLILNPEVHRIKINKADWPSTAKIYVNKNISEIKYEPEVGIIDNLEMSRSYKICLSIDDDECPRKEESCQDCQTVTTSLGVPFPPENIRFEEKNSTLKITWNQPKNYSGENLQYKIEWEGKCKVNNEICNKVFSCEDKNTFKQTNREAVITEVKPYWDYRIKVFTVNKEGQSINATIDTYQTPAVVKKPRIKNITTGGKQIYFEYEPYCPYTGPLSFTFKFYGHGYSKDIIQVYNLEAYQTPSKKISFDYLMPTKQYQLIVITSLLYDPSKKETEIHTISTNQIPPEGIPKIKKGEVTETSIKIKVIKPNNTYETTIEALTYYIEANSTCAYSNERCNESEICSSTFNEYTKSTNDKSFELTFPDLLPFSKNKFRSMVSNNAGNGAWSEWLEVITTQMSLETLDALKTTFRVFTDETSLNVVVDPVCPYQGPYSWKTCLYQSDSRVLKTYKTLNFSHKLQTFDPKQVFSSLGYGQIFDVCVIRGTPSETLSDCKNTCGKDEEELFNNLCKCHIATRCNDLPEPTNAPEQIQWVSMNDDFNPFQNIKFQMVEKTFNEFTSGLNKFLIKYSIEGQPEKQEDGSNMNWGKSSFHVLKGLKPGKNVQVSIVVFACRQQKKETPKATMKTETFEPGKFELVEDDANQIKSYKKDDKWKMQVTITETKKNIKYAGIKSYTFGEDIIQMENLFNNTILEALDISDGGRCLETKNSIDQMMCTIEIDYFEGTLDVTIATKLPGSEVVTVSIENQTSQTLGTSSTVLLVVLTLVIVAGIYAGVHYVKNGQLPLLAKIFAGRSAIVADQVDVDIEMDEKVNLKSDDVDLPESTYETSSPIEKFQLLKQIKSDEDFSEFVEEEFERLSYTDQKLIQPHKTTDEARRLMLNQNLSTKHFPLNRYKNILPYDDTRVVLLKKRKDMDYINANWIHGFNGPRDFIATQAPLQNTIPFFWQMILENKIKVIVMISKIKETKQDKKNDGFDKYWPNIAKSITYDNIQVKNLAEAHISTPKYTIERKLQVKKIEPEGKRASQPTTVTQIHYYGWPDYQTPEDPQIILDLNQVLKHIQAKISKNEPEAEYSPILVHCSNGVGPTGIFIGFNTLAQAVDSDNPNIDVFSTVFNMRKERYAMVQNGVQYKYLYHCVAKHLESPPQNQDQSEGDNFYENIFYAEKSPDELYFFQYVK